MCCEWRSRGASIAQFCFCYGEWKFKVTHTQLMSHGRHWQAAWGSTAQKNGVLLTACSQGQHLHTRKASFSRHVLYGKYTQEWVPSHGMCSRAASAHKKGVFLAACALRQVHTIMGSFSQHLLKGKYTQKWVPSHSMCSWAASAHKKGVFLTSHGMCPEASTHKNGVFSQHVLKKSICTQEWGLSHGMCSEATRADSRRKCCIKEWGPPAHTPQYSSQTHLTIS
jgi:hypothetical protein